MTDLCRKITRAKDLSKKILRVASVINQSAQPTEFIGHEWCELFQPFENAVDTRGRGLAVEEPIIATSRSRAPIPRSTD